MRRLIDADDLEYIKIWDIGNSISSDQKEFIDCVNKQLTAFDVDKVVEQECFMGCPGDQGETIRKLQSNE